MKSRVVDAICWDGVYANICIYAVFEMELKPNFHVDFSSAECALARVYEPIVLEDEDFKLGKRKTYLFEIQLDTIPNDFVKYLEDCVARLVKNNAECVWFAFDGAFDFDQLFTYGVADQYYCVYHRATGLFTALTDSQLTSSDWREKIEKIQKVLNMS
jgi:hypothetical protein